MMMMMLRRERGRGGHDPVAVHACRVFEEVDKNGERYVVVRVAW